MQQSLLTIVIPAYKAEATIMRAINSVKASTEQVNIIVVEDGVYDGLQNLLLNEDKVQLITKNKNAGASAARNTGLNLVKTKYVFFLDSDDYVDKNLFKNLVAAMEQANADMGFGPWAFVYSNGVVSAFHYPKRCSNTEYITNWLRNDCTPPCSQIWKTDSLRSIGAWDETFSNKDDAELGFRAFMNNLVIAVSNDGCGYYVQHDGKDRLSRAPAKIASESAMRIFKKVKQWNKTIQSESVNEALAFYCYEHARRMYRYGEHELGDTWLNLTRSLGVHGHIGSFAHVVAASILGLHRKERIASLRDKYEWTKHKFN